MERRLLIAILLSVVVLYGFQALLKPKPNGSAGQTTTTAPDVAAPPQTPATQASTASPSTATPAAPAAAPLVADTAEREIRVETRDVIAVFTNRGARLKSWRLKHYFDQNGQPQELIDPLPNQPLPFSLRTPSESTTAIINNALYSAPAQPDGTTNASIDLKFEYRDSSGLASVKEFHIEPASYLMTFRGAVTHNSSAVPTTIQWGPAVGDAATSNSYAQKPGGLLADAARIQRLGATKEIAKQSSYEGDFKYAGVDDNYFMSIALAPGPVNIAYQPVSIPGPGPKDPPRELVAYSITPQKPDTPIKFFVGPKDFDVLAQLGPDMTKAINFGIFSVIVVPLLRSLKWVNTYVGNYGWSIVVLTVIIQIILFPLQHKSIVSMRKMQEIQPQMKAIQDRYAKYKATDPEKQNMNKEVMALYREKGVNPASGCVPIVLTMPLLLAMWAMLQTSIELRGAPFLWIRDLTLRDPFYVTPVLMGLTQFWQQKITPATGADPAQQKMMMVMPVVMTVMFITLPAGALVYYTVSNLLRIGQQYLTNSIIGPPNVRAVRPPAERRVKRVGGGKTDAATNKS
ncbi:MAG TPA: membrane protein insertase YidC [Vicinamibacterales bacterium]